MIASYKLMNSRPLCEWTKIGETQGSPSPYIINMIEIIKISISSSYVPHKGFFFYWYIVV